MRSLSLSVIAGVLLIVTSFEALAADPSAFPASPISLMYNWTGFYVGLNVGDAESTGTLTDGLTGTNIGVNRNGAVGGAQLGYNILVNNIVFGVEWNLDGADLNTSRSTAAFSGTANTNWITTLAGRVGFASNNWLYYGKAGAGWVNNQATLTDVATDTSVSTSKTNSGWLLGAGIEFALPPIAPTYPPAWSVKLEYDYLGLVRGIPVFFL